MLNRKRSFFAIIVLLVALMASLLLKVFPLEEKLEEYKETRSYFGAYFTIDCRYDKKLTDIRAVTEECWRKLDVIELNMNSGSPLGYLGLVNRSIPNVGVKVNDDLYHIIRDAIGYSERTQGAFDITVRPLVILWKQAAARNKLPTQEELTAVLEKIGSKYIRLQAPDTVVLTRPGMKLDVNAIAPAFAVDLIARMLTEHKIKNYMVDGSGEIACKGNQRGVSGWRLGVQDPSKKDTNAVTDILILKDAAVSTSGNYERYYLIAGQKYSHIIDPRTGRPANEVISATVIAPTAEEANAFSTPLCVLGGKEGIKLVSVRKGVEALILEKLDGKIVSVETPGYRKYRAPK